MLYKIGERGEETVPNGAITRRVYGEFGIFREFFPFFSLQLEVVCQCLNTATGTLSQPEAASGLRVQCQNRLLISSTPRSYTPSLRALALLSVLNYARHLAVLKDGKVSPW